MKFTINTKSLKRACTLLKAGCASKSTKRIFECARLELGDGIDTLKISTTDLQHAITLRLPVTETEGSVGVAVVPLAQIAKLASQKADEISFELDTKKNELHAKWTGKRTSARRQIEGENAEQYPTLTETDGPGWIDVPELGETLIEASRFVGKEAARFVLNGIKLENGRVIGCDGRRLYTRELAELGIADVIISLPKLGAPTIRKLNQVRTVNDGRAVQFRDGDLTVTTRVLEGTFPDWKQIMPQESNGKSSDIDAEAWLEALDAVKDCTGVQSQAVIMEFKEDCVTLTAKGSEAGGEATIEQDTGELGRDNRAAEESCSRVGVNPAYLEDFLKLSPTKVLGTGKNSAWKFTADGGRELVVMPVLID